MSGLRCLLFALLAAVRVEKLAATGTLEVKFYHYKNPEGKGANGNCCESIFSFNCHTHCDHKFKICVGHIDASNSISDCDYYKVDTDTVTLNDFHFGPTLTQNNPNPVKIQRNAVVTSFRVKVEVWDVDPGNDDLVDVLNRAIRDVQVDPQAFSSVYKTAVLQDKTTLTIQYKAYCNQYYYPPTCTRYCKPQNDANGHYSCHSLTGTKICHMGWKGDNCETDINECEAEENPCKNGGNCTNLPGVYKCKCKEGSAGMHCNSITNKCVLDPCQHGATCHGNETSYSCTCAPGWRGDRCEEEVDACENSPCENNGTCISSPQRKSEFTCGCESGWTGKLCEVEVDGTTTMSSAATPSSMRTTPIPTYSTTILPPTTTAPFYIIGVPVQITLEGVINERNRPKLVQGIKDIIRVFGGINDTVSLNITTHVIKAGVTVTSVSFVSAVERTVLDPKRIGSLFVDYPPEELNPYLPLPLYVPGGETQGLHVRNEESWFANNWYAVFLPLLIALILVVILVFILLRRRRDKSALMENLDQPPTTSFENVLYTQNQATNQQRPLPNPEYDNPTEPSRPVEGATCANDMNPYTEPHPHSQYDTPVKQDACAAGPYMNSNMASLDTRCEAGKNDYTDFDNLDGAMAKEENHYQDLDEITHQKTNGGFVDDSDVNSTPDDSEDEQDEIARIKASIRQQEEHGPDGHSEA